MVRRTAVVAAATALALVVGAAGSAAARRADGPGTIGAPGVGDRVFPGLGNGGYEADAYDIDLTYDALARRVLGKVRISATASADLARFDLDAVGLDIVGVEVDGAKAAFAQAGEELQITPATPALKGRQFAVVVDYSADPRRISQPVGGFVPTADGFATAPQPAGAHAVFPCNDHPSDKAAYTVRITAPTGLTGVANGALIDSAANADGTTTWTYRSRDPLATELVQISVGTYTVLERTGQQAGFLRDVVPTLRVPASSAALALTPSQQTWISDQLGGFPLEGYGILVADSDDPKAFDFTGLETQTLTLYKPAYLTQAEDKIGGHMVHELTHSWFGDSVTPSTWSDLWLNEGHAELYGLMYRYSRGWPDAKNYTNLDDRMRWTYGQGAIWRSTSGPVARPSAATLFDNQRYTGGTLVLYALRERVGPEVFTRIERDFLTRFRGGNASSEDYIDVAVEVSQDATVGPFLRDWLYGTTTPPMPNHPDWTVDPVPPPVPAAPAPPTPPARTDRLE